MSVQPASAPHRRALFAAGAVFVLGYGVLAIASAAGLGDQSLPGLYTFRSATVGDGLLLPLLAYSLVRVAGRTRPLREKRTVAVAAVIGALLGVATQVQWLMNQQVVLNWTLPKAGTFNIIGWYHAVFLVGSCGFFAILWLLRRSCYRCGDEAETGTCEGGGESPGGWHPVCARPRVDIRCDVGGGQRRR
jgi:hypothetical protein